jgi:hypothetical protein
VPDGGGRVASAVVVVVRAVVKAHPRSGQTERWYQTMLSVDDLG